MLQMKGECEACKNGILPNGEAYICSYECSYCTECAQRMEHKCPNCGGELVRRPKRVT